MTHTPPDHDLKDRINELNAKATQMLAFLSFAIVGAATVEGQKLVTNTVLVRAAIKWWVLAMFPVLFGVLPVKDFWGKWLPWSERSWLQFMRWLKVFAMIGAVGLSAQGAYRFLQAVLHP